MELEVPKELLDYLKEENRDFHALVDIKPYDGYTDKTHSIDYISVEYYRDSEPPRISYKTIYMDLKSILRECKINTFLAFKEPETDFDVESVIYTPAQRDRLSILRKEADKTIVTASTRVYGFSELRKTRLEYSQSFEVGDRVHYNHYKGVITFKHAEKDSSKEQRWTVKVNDTEYRYVYGTALRKRKVEDLSHIPIDKELDKLSTEKLLKIFRKTRVRGVGNVKIKRILYDREHFQKGETKIKNLC